MFEKITKRNFKFIIKKKKKGYQLNMFEEII